MASRAAFMAKSHQTVNFRRNNVSTTYAYFYLRYLLFCNRKQTNKRRSASNPWTGFPAYITATMTTMMMAMEMGNGEWPMANGSWWARFNGSVVTHIPKVILISISFDSVRFAIATRANHQFGKDTTNEFNWWKPLLAAGLELYFLAMASTTNCATPLARWENLIFQLEAMASGKRILPAGARVSQSCLRPCRRMLL